MNWIINTRLLGNPMNWFSIGAMLLLVAVAFIAIRSHLKMSILPADLVDNPAAAMQEEK